MPMNSLFEAALRILVFVIGLGLVLTSLRSAIRILILPRNVNDKIGRFVFVGMRRLFNLRTRNARSYEERDAIMAMYAPVSLLLLPAVWLVIVLVGYMGIYWSIGAGTMGAVFRVSGSSLFTLGFATVDDGITTLMVFTEAAIGLVLVALLIAYLPTIYSAFQRREAAVTLLEVRAGSPPSAATLIQRYHRLGLLDRLNELWASWEVWFVDIEETHTSLGALAFFRSPQGHRSWITAAGAVLDAAAICASTVDIRRDPQQDLCIRAGYLALRYIADYFRIPHDPKPDPADPISVARSEFDAVYDQLLASGVPVKLDRDDCWRRFAGWRVNYDTVLVSLCSFLMAPEAPWSSDRSIRTLKVRSYWWMR
jgi:hypothetical protein